MSDLQINNGTPGDPNIEFSGSAPETVEINKTAGLSGSSDLSGPRGTEYAKSGGKVGSGDLSGAPGGEYIKHGALQSEASLNAPDTSTTTKTGGLVIDNGLIGGTQTTTAGAGGVDSDGELGGQQHRDIVRSGGVSGDTALEGSSHQAYTKYAQVYTEGNLSDGPTEVVKTGGLSSEALLAGRGGAARAWVWTPAPIYYNNDGPGRFSPAISKVRKGKLSTEALLGSVRRMDLNRQTALSATVGMSGVSVVEDMRPARRRREEEDLLLLEAL